MIRSSPQVAKPEYLDHVICQIYPVYNRTETVPDEDEWQISFERKDGLVSFSEPGTKFWLVGQEVESYECA